jgi:acetate kinase
MVLWLLEHTGLAEHDLSEALEHESGLLALAGNADMRAVLHDVGEGDERATLALGVYEHSLRAHIAAMAAAMGGLDALVFCGGVGEHSPAVRARATTGLEFLGIGIDHGVNADGHVDRDLTAHGSPVRTLVVEAREDLEIARQVNELLAVRAADPSNGGRAADRRVQFSGEPCDLPS